MACAMPVPQPSMAVPARNAASCIPARASRSRPSATAWGRCWPTSPSAVSAGSGGRSSRRWPVTASRAWTKASRPVIAVTAGGMVAVASGSSTTRSGSSSSPHVHTFRPSASVRTHVRVTSAPGTRGGRDGDDRPAARDRMAGQDVVPDAGRATEHDGDLLGRVDRGATADARRRAAGRGRGPARRRRRPRRRWARPAAGPARAPRPRRLPPRPVRRSRWPPPPRRPRGRRTGSPPPGGSGRDRPAPRRPSRPPAPAGRSMSRLLTVHVSWRRAQTAAAGVSIVAPRAGSQ